MRIRSFVFVIAVLAISIGAFGQAAPPVPSTAPAPPCPAMPGMPQGHGGMTVMYRHEMGKWWQNSETAKKLQLSESQISQLDQTFLDHRLKLIQVSADMEKQDLKLQSMLDADVPNEGQINSQVDQVLEARGKLEREHTMMNLELRKVLSLEQWRQLRSMHGGMEDHMFFHKTFAPGGKPMTAPLPPGAELLPPLPPAGAEDMF
jgi:Spy/CpxP family protein refolding chaperone